MKNWDKKLASLIDHTKLRPEAREGDIEKLCREALAYGFASVVVQPYYVPLALSLLSGSAIPVCSVISFPLGGHPPKSKALEAERLLEAGVGEIDMVMNLGAFLSGKYGVIEEELRLVASLCRDRAVFKLIIEIAYLDRTGIELASKFGVGAGADFIKTSTGFAPKGAGVEEVRIIRSVVGSRAGVKAAGGIRSRDFALELVEAGADRLGCSASLEVVKL